MPVSSTPQRRNARHLEQHPTDSSGAAGRPGRALSAAERGSWSATASFPPQPRNVALARRLTRTALAAWGVPELADSAELVVSELVTNSVRYGRGAVSLTLVLTDGALQISVADFGRGLPRVRRAGDDEPTGRGLSIVTAISARWLVTTRLTGKTVSCWLDR
ncbi:ATP-binding protein [Kitasatospora sp. NPDC048540]|uniref:ATP-binding protein n=1 Tax=Kitasatospora sp. NPDC048540 TaxID=3155634 RepID=UPI0033C0930A